MNLWQAFNYNGINYANNINEYDDLTMKQILPINFGTKPDGTPFIYDLHTAQNILICGAVGSGKDLIINSIIKSIADQFTAKECEFVIIDPRGVRHNEWSTLPHLATQIIRLDASIIHLQNQITEIKRRQTQHNFAPRIIIISELGEFMLQNAENTTTCINEIIKLGHATDVFLIVATQLIDKTTLTKPIQNMFKTRISLHAHNKQKSIMQLGLPGAENLKFCGEAIIYSKGTLPTKITVPFISENEIKNFVKKLHR